MERQTGAAFETIRGAGAKVTGVADVKAASGRSPASPGQERRVELEMNFGDSARDYGMITPTLSCVTAGQSS